MGALTVEFVMHLEDRMRFLAEKAAASLLDEMWWSRIARVIPSSAHTENFAWFLDTAIIENEEEGGNINFRDMVMQNTSYTNKYAGTGLKVRRSQFLDLDGNGVQMAAHWATEIGAESQYWPQKSISDAILAGGTGTAYDGKTFFANIGSGAAYPHPVNPSNTAFGVYSNDFTGAAATENSIANAYPGAVPIDTSVSVEVALTNLTKVYKYMAGIKSSNGLRSRNLRPGTLLVPPSLMPRATQLCNAKFIAQVAESSTSAGSGDVEAMIQMLGMGQPVMCPELGAAMGGSDTTFYVVAKQAESSLLGALTYVEREPFAVRYYTGDGGGTGVDADLDRKQEYEWHCQGRNIAGYGHPYLIFRCKAA